MYKQGFKMNGILLSSLSRKGRQLSHRELAFIGVQLTRGGPGTREITFDLAIGPGVDEAVSVFGGAGVTPKPRSREDVHHRDNQRNNKENDGSKLGEKRITPVLFVNATHRNVIKSIFDQLGEKHKNYGCTGVQNGWKHIWDLSEV